VFAKLGISSGGELRRALPGLAEVAGAGLALPSGELSWRGIAADGGREVDGCLPAVARTRPGTSMRLIDAASTRPACGSATLHLPGQDMGLGASARGTARARTLEW